MSFKLVVRMSGSDDTVMSEHVFDKKEVLIGRSMSNDVVLPDVQKRVSSKHARIENSGTAYRLTDLGSTNGTFLNDRKLEAKQTQEIKNGDRVVIGVFLITFAVEDDPMDQTMIHVDVGRKSGDIADEITSLYARNLDQAPQKRRDMIRKALESSLGSVGKDKKRSMLNQIKARFETSAIPAAAQIDRSTFVRRKDAEIEMAEELYQAGFKAISELSAKFCGEQKFQSPDQMERFVGMLESTVSITADWIGKSLKGRGEFENQFSADLTMIFAKDKNPLKEGGTAEDIGRFLLDWSAIRDAKVVAQSLEDAFKDLTMHQLGLLAGVQESLSAVLQRLDPKAVETEVLEKKGGFLAKMGLAKKAWEHYGEIYKEIFAENSKMFNEMIYPNVRKGYLKVHSDDDESKPPEKKE